MIKMMMMIMIIITVSLGHHRDVEGTLCNFDDSDAYAVEADARHIAKRTD